MVCEASKDGGTFLLNCPWTAEEMERAAARFHEADALRKKHLQFYNIDAIEIAGEVGLGNRINTVLQAAFFKLAGVIPDR